MPAVDQITEHKMSLNPLIRLLRVVRCLPLIAALPGASRTYRAGVGQALREETAEYTKTGQDRRRAMGIWGVARLFGLTNQPVCR